jgi:SAM-dependent methyltransferase
MDGHAQREREFHDKIHTDESRSPLSRFYTVTDSSADAYHSAVVENCRGKRVLEIGCGRTVFAIDLAERGATVTAIDISEVAVRRSHHEAGARPGLTYEVMDAEHLAFPDDSFDVVCGRSVIHHLDLERAFAELRRVMKPDGRAIFLEPLGHNPVLNAYRRMTPAHHSADEHPLKTVDLDLVRRNFASVDVAYFHLASLAAIPLYGTGFFRRTLRVLERVDKAVLRTPLSRFAWIVVIAAGGPVKS